MPEPLKYFYRISIDSKVYERMRSGELPTDLIRPSLLRLAEEMETVSPDQRFRVLSQDSPRREYVGNFATIIWESERQITVYA